MFISCLPTRLKRVQWALRRVQSSLQYTRTEIMEKGGVREERRSRSPQGRKEMPKPMSAVEEVNKEPQYVVDREKVRRCQVTPFEAQLSLGEGYVRVHLLL